MLQRHTAIDIVNLEATVSPFCTEVRHMNKKDTLLSRKAVSDMLGGMSKATIYRWIKTMGFPPPISFGTRYVRWSEAEVAAWVERHKSQRTAA